MKCKTEYIEVDGEIRQVTQCQQQQGGGGGSSSSSSQSTTSTNTDKRLVVSSGVGVTGDNTSVTVNTLDAGIVDKALQTVANSNAIQGGNFDKLLVAATHLIDGGVNAVATGVSQVAASQQALVAAQTDQTGKIDNKTIAIGVLAIAGAWAYSHHRA